MKKLTRIALICAGAIVALLAIALLGVNLYVQSRATQQRIQQELSQRLGTSLKIERISVTPWFGLTLSGITMPQGNEAAPDDFLRADAFRLRVRFMSLFRGRLVINEVSLIHPKVVWAQNENGKWRLPSAEAADEGETVAIPAAPAQPAVSSPSAASPVPEGAVVAASPNATMPAPVATEAAAPPFTPEVHRVRLTNGSFHFLDTHGRPVASFEGVRFRSSFRNSTELQGDASIERISLRDRFFLKDLKSPVKYDPAELTFSQITAHAAGGQIAGEFSMNPTESDSPFSAKIVFRDMKADRVLTEAGGPAGMLQGRIEGRLEATGKTADANALAGAGEIHLREGEVRQFGLLVAFGQLLQINELTQLHLDQAEVKYHITPGVVMVDELVLASPNIRLSSNGTIDFQGRLKLESQLAISERVRGQLFGGMRASFQPTAAPGFSAVAFQVTGTIERPRTNLMDKLVGRDLRDLGGVINSLLGGRSSHPRKKKILDEPPLPPVPAAPPSPVESPVEAPASAPSSSPAP